MIKDLLKQGLICHQRGELENASIFYKKILTFQANHFEALQLLGAIYIQKKDFINATAFISKSLEFEPNQAVANFNLGIALHQLGRLNEAIDSYEKATDIEPQYSDAFINRGIIFSELKQYKNAVRCFDLALNINPHNALALFNLGLVFEKHNLLNQALDCYNNAIAIDTNYYEAFLHQGNALQELNRFDEALQSFDKAISLSHNFPIPYFNKGNAFIQIKRFSDAISCFKKAIELDSTFSEAHLNLSICYLTTGNFTDGWQSYEWRRKIESSKIASKSKNYNQALWLGNESLIGKVILLYAEQGLGDTIQFSRYISLVSQLGAIVLLEVQDSLVSLFKNVEGIHAIIRETDTRPNFDFHCPLLSLPLAFKTDLKSIPPSTKIDIDSNKISFWNNILGSKTRPRIGIAWSGSAIHKNDYNRTISLDLIIPFLSPNFEYICLQKEIRQDDSSAFSKSNVIRFFGDYMQDMADTAALITLLDSVITVDTCIAHLAGTLRKPTYVLLPYICDWRWLDVETKSPWYPSIELFRQKSRGDWNFALRNAFIGLTSNLKNTEH